MQGSPAPRHPSSASRSAAVAIVAAHPDDEVLGIGGRLAELGSITLVHLTDGAPRDMTDERSAGFETCEAYARARRDELDRALAAAGAAPAHRIQLGLADQETPFQLAAIARMLMPILAAAECVITHPYEGGHPDHDAAAFAVQAACAQLAQSRGRAPRRLEFPSYHAAGEAVSWGRFWLDPGHPEVVFELDPAQRGRKRAALAAFVSQRTVIAQFSAEAERLRGAPTYDFELPPPRALRSTTDSAGRSKALDGDARRRGRSLRSSSRDGS